jgi:hypothetical protein
MVISSNMVNGKYPRCVEIETSTGEFIHALVVDKEEELDTDGEDAVE